MTYRTSTWKGKALLPRRVFYHYTVTRAGTSLPVCTLAIHLIACYTMQSKLSPVHKDSRSTMFASYVSDFEPLVIAIGFGFAILVIFCVCRRRANKVM